MTQAAQQSTDGFFSGGGKSVKFAEIGDSITGIIAAVHQPEQQTTPQGDLVFDKKTNAPKMQVRIELTTDLRDPADQFDDGRRTLYVKGWMKGALGDALRRAGRSGAPEIGGKLTVTFTAEEPNPGLSATKKYSAVYENPSGSAGADGFFGGEPAPAAAAPGEPLPECPKGITAASWAAMDDATKRNLAKTMADLPPF